ncbi:MAG: hypothetical protein HY289_06015 [Planctomycetes bacterium]|nr:hypothetical protein [Planctomycetota bacterium]
MLQPKEEGKIEVFLDTRLFIGTKPVTVYVQTYEKRLAEHRFWVQANSRDDLAFSPDRFDFGKITRGNTPTAHLVMTMLNQPKLQVTAAKCDNTFIQIKVQERERGAKQTTCRISATVAADTPAGELRTEVELSTNNPAMPSLVVPVTIVVEKPN